MMHVCHFCETSINTRYFKTMAQGLSEKGVEVSLVELGSHDPPEWLDEFCGVKYFSLGATAKWQYPLAIWRLGRLLRREKIDVLQAHLYYAGLISVLAKRLHPKTTVALTRHYTGVVRMLGTRAHVALDAWMAKKADRSVTVSRAARDYMREVDGVHRAIDVVYNGIDFEQFGSDTAARSRVRNEFGFGDSDFVIGYIGNFAPGKGHVQLVRAFGEIAKEIPEARLLLVGRGRLEEVDRTVEELLLHGNVVFAGWRDDAAACLNAMDVFVQPSLSEAFSQVLVEAMGVGLPVIATRVGGANEAVEDEETGFLIEPNDTQAIYQRVVAMYREPERRGKIAAAGQKAARENFTVERMIEDQFELYKKWLAAK